jgi:hypothetical protein
MASDAIARQYDVNKNSVILTCEPGKQSYRPGTIAFAAKAGKSIDLAKMRESIAATRLSGGTNMGMEYLEITATGAVQASDKGTLERLRDALARGEKLSSVTGRVQGWNGRFPDVLKALEKAPPESRSVLLVTDFEMHKK